MSRPIFIKAALCAVAASAFAFAPAAFAGHHGRGGGWHGGYHGGWHGGYHGGWHGYRGHYGHYYHRDHFGRWVAGAVVVGAVAGLIADATQPRSVVYYDDPPVVYRRERVIYEREPVVYERRVYETRTVYEDPYQTRYIRDDGYDGD